MTTYQWKVIMALCKLVIFHWNHNGPSEEIEFIKDAIERSEYEDQLIQHRQE